MAHRRDEKQQKRDERLAKEAEAGRLAARKRRRAWFAGGFLLLIVAGVGVGVVLSGGDGNSGGPKATASGSLPKIPAQQETDLIKAAAAAGCTLTNPALEGAAHENKTFKPSDYGTNPPTSGTHYPSPAEDGVYDRANPPVLGETVHSLEHGRIGVQYSPKSTALTARQLETVVNELDGGYHQLLFVNQTNMPYAVAATAWGHSLTCPKMNNKVFDAVRTFRSQYIDKGPETVP